MPKGTQSYSYDCGTKVLHLVMAYYGEEYPYYELLNRAKEHKRYGLPESSLIQMAKARSFKIIAHDNFTLAEIKEQLNKGHPVIVLVQGWGKVETDWKTTNEYTHYSIVIGIEHGKVFFNDPLSFKKAWLTEEEFLERWHADDKINYAIVIYKQRGLFNALEHMW